LTLPVPEMTRTDLWDDATLAAISLE
jgi:hypothetical protein